MWSLVLSDYFVVTGIDNSTEAEKNFQMLKAKYPASGAVEFMRGMYCSFQNQPDMTIYFVEDPNSSEAIIPSRRFFDSLKRP